MKITDMTEAPAGSQLKNIFMPSIVSALYTALASKPK